MSPPDGGRPVLAWSALLLDVWRQVTEHLELAECAEELARRLRRDLPLARLRLLGFDRGRQRVEVLAVAPWTGADVEGRPVPPPQARDLEAWIRASQVEALPARLHRLLHPGGGYRPILAGGLVDRGEPVGIAEFDGGPELAGHADLLRALLAPLVVALRNDRRLHELARLREAVEAENRALLTRLERDGLAGAVVGADAGLREVMGRVQQVATTQAPVLLLGETGTGKELIAREVHGRSPRSNGPFLKVNCGAIPPDLVDSELFGHDKGSFTGAVGERRGWFERADGGTLFLDEIGELPPAVQVRLLRVLQDGTFERVGGERPLHADVRIVAATHRDLGEMVADGRFREDLWYRICVFPVHLPPLRERAGDIEALAVHFAARAGLRLHGRELPVTADDLEALSAYPWPGNVRELASVVERAAILGDGHRLDVRAALGQAPAVPRAKSATPPSPGPREAAPPVAAGSLEDITRRAIEDALRATAGRIEGRGGVADRLGISPSTLRSRMKRLGIDWRRHRAGA